MKAVGDLPYLACPPLAGGAYGRWFTDTTIWRPYVEWVARRHALPAPRELSVGTPGSHPVFMTANGYVVKFYAPHWPSDARSESAVFECLRATSLAAVPRPAVLAGGRLFAGGEPWAWPYAVFVSMKGRALADLGAHWPPSAWTTTAHELGRIVRALHEVPLDDTVPDFASWSAYEMSNLLRTAPERRRHDPAWARLDFEAWEAHWQEVIDREWIRPCLLHGDLTADHVFIQKSSDAVRITGLIDWADALIGDPAYELVAVYVDLFRGQRDQFMAFRSGYGDGPMFRPTWKRRATAWLLAYRFDVGSMLAAIRPALSSINSFQDVEEIVWEGF